MSPRSSSRGARLALGVVALVAALGGAELLLRVRASAVRREIETRNGWTPEGACTQADPRLLYRPIAERCGTNSAGFLDGEHTVAKPPGVFRVVVIGDSVAAGVGDLQAIGRSFAHRLGEVARKECEGHSVEVIVLAVSGYASSQELLLLEEEGLRYEPDLVLWSYCLNDPADPVFHGYNGELGVYFDRPDFYLPALARRAAFLLRESALARLRRCPEEQHRRLHCVYAEQVGALFATLGRIQSEQGVPIVVLLQPLIEDHGAPETYGFADLHAWLVARAAEHGIASIDVLPAYLGHSWREIGNGISKSGWFDCYHPSHVGHELAAQYLFAELVRGGLLPCAGGPASSASSAKTRAGSSALN
jgi:lysophospholipase L1-like esterase